MNYDTPMVYALVFFFSCVVSGKFVVLPGYRYVTSFSVVKKNVVKDYQKRIAQLEHDNGLLRQGIFISQEKTGQLHFDMPAEEPETKVFEMVFKRHGNMEKWRQVWDMRDWVSYTQNKHFVKRGKRFLWVEELLPNEKEVALPFKWEFVGHAEKVVQRKKRRKQA